MIDGIDGCGKSTQAERLVARLAREAPERRAPLHLREPGSTPLGEVLRSALLEGEDLSPEVEALIVTAARRHMLERVVEPALAAGRDVVCERFHPSTFAYQGVAGGLGAERVLSFLAEWAPEPEPDLVLVLDVEPARAADRRGPASDRIEARGLDYQGRVASGFAEYAERVPGTVRLDGERSVDEVEEAVWREVSSAGA